MACLLFAVSATSFAPKTEAGRQCPTAAVQEIEVTRTVETCCGDVVQVVEKRKPQVGEEGFLQCQCAEKKSSDFADGKRTGELPVFTLPEAILLPASNLIAAWDDPDLRPTMLPSGPSSTPPTPPPNFI